MCPIYHIKVHVLKRTTGRHYAMKIQYKKELLKNFASNPSKLDNEKVRPYSNEISVTSPQHIHIGRGIAI